MNDRSSAPRFFVFRRSVKFTSQELFVNEARRYVWQRIPIRAADTPWSNIPDPRLRQQLFTEGVPDVTVLERIGNAAPSD